jgi:hypothetical protein
MKTNRILVMCALAAILLAAEAGCSGSSVSKNVPATTPSQATSVSPPYAGSAALDVQKYIQNYQEGIEPTTSIPPVSPSEAKTKTGISLRLPKDTALTGELKAIYPDTSASGNPQLALHFKNGVLIAEEAWKEKPDFAHEIAIDSDPKYHQSPATPGSSWTLVAVAGFQGKLLPQPAVLGADQKICELPPQLEWWNSGIKYRMTTWKMGYSGQQLLDIANSMY